MLKKLMPSLSLMITADYKTVKSMETEKIIKEMLQGLTPVKKPELLQISGIPGSGKSTFCAKHTLPNYLFLSFDKIMSKLSGYQQTLKEEGAIVAYSRYEMPARIIGYELLRRAIAMNINIMFEHSGTNKAHLELFKNLPRKGYQTAVDFIICDTNLAVKRAKERAAVINRYVPESVINERAEKFKGYISEYQKLTPHIKYFDGENNFTRLKI